MQRVHYDGRWHLSGFHAPMLSNRWIRLVLLPELGGKLWSLEYRPRALEWLWHNPRVPLTRAPFGSSFDDHWAGGADVAFPSCYTSYWDGWSVPELGEWWSIPWNARFDEDDQTGALVLSAGGRVWPVEVTRAIRLAHEAPVVTLEFQITNISQKPYPFVMGFHPALAIAPGHRIDVSPGMVQVDESDGIGTIGQKYCWPWLPTPQGERDMRMVPPPTRGEYGGHFLRPSGPDLWWAVTDSRQRTGLGLAAPRDQFAGFWMWQVYGGWRGYYHLALEPWTGYPITLHRAVEAGSAQWLMPGEPYHTTLTLTCFEGMDHVNRIDLEGNVYGG